MTQLFLSRFRRDGFMKAADEDALMSVFSRQFQAAGGKTLLRPGDLAASILILREGVACRYKATADGQRQMTSLMLPGDLCSAEAVFFSHVHASLETLSVCMFASASSQAVRELISSRPGIAMAFWGAALEEEAIHREWLLNVGQRSAPSRLAHFLCEFIVRSGGMNGQGDEVRCSFPLTEVQIADAAGLSVVHVNRVLRSLEDVVKLEAGTVAVSDWQRLADIAAFDPHYLRFTPTADEASASRSRSTPAANLNGESSEIRLRPQAD